MLAYAAFALSFVLSLLYLIQNRQIRRGRTGILFARLPALEVIGRMNRTSVTIGLVVLSVAIVLGVTWARRVWTVPVDAKLAWALITLLVYGVLLWMDRRGWAGPRVALLSIVGFILVLFSYTIVNLYLSQSHVFR
jgi:ABC-type transport system involved in cytochrome c biogenesis permease subunit